MMPDSADLLSRAREAAGRAHAPYSRFRVGASVLACDRVFQGCNVENASYGLTICAERNAIFAAVVAGATRIEALALSCVDAPPGSASSLLMPCGACRQVMAEFAGPDLPVHIDRVGSTTLAALLPGAFRLS